MAHGPRGRGRDADTSRHILDQGQARQSMQQTDHLSEDMDKMRLATPDASQDDLDGVTHYGNTQAIILPFYRTSDGLVARFSPRPVYMRPEDRITARKTKQDRVRVYTARLETDDYTRDRPASCAPAREALAKYGRHRILYNERVHASNYVSHIEHEGSLYSR